MIKINKKYYKHLLVVTALVILSVAALLARTEEIEITYLSSTVELGSISNTITAIGTLEATNTVIVGTQVSGVIQKLHVDFNSKVQKGQLIAELDKATLQSSQENSEADLERAVATLDYHESNYNRKKALFEKEMLAESEYDLALFNYKTSLAGVKSAKANLARSQRNLTYASIYSPIDGVVLNRAVEEGQTVAASMNTPELFTITNDLSTMQVEASVDEADIGYLKTEQRVVFTVDAFPEQIFEGTVSEIRLQPNATSNVITYNAIISLQNLDLKLKPGMTASITIFIEEANNVLLVPTNAIEFSPNRELLAQQNGHGQSVKEHRPPPPPADSLEADGSHIAGDIAAPETVWVKTDETIIPVQITVGIDDGANIQVLEGLEEGMQVITSEEYTSHSTLLASSSNTDEPKSPFIQETQRGQGASGGPGGGGPSGPPPR